MRVASWNVNSIRARQERAIAWLERHQPDVLCLQETKVQDEAFPHEPFAALGYQTALHGQKTYNGVAILSRIPIDGLERGMQDESEDPQARFMAAELNDWLIVNVYVPNGSTPQSAKYAYKQQWLQRLANWIDKNKTAERLALVCGDFNIAPADVDVAAPERWADSVLCAPEMRHAFANLQARGLVDAWRQLNPDEKAYSWWDYRGLAFPRNDGLRIDHMLVSSGLQARCDRVWIDRDERKGQRPSDHAPVVGDFKP